MQNKWLFKFIRAKKKSEVGSLKLKSEKKSLHEYNNKKEKLVEEKVFEVNVSSENLKENISALSISSIKLKKQAKQEKDLIESEGLEWTVVESIPVHEEIKYGGENKDYYIQNYIESIKNISKAGIKIICYNSYA